MSTQRILSSKAVAPDWKVCYNFIISESNGYLHEFLDWQGWILEFDKDLYELSDFEKDIKKHYYKNIFI